jgi:limonene 1,2-monooxygenase
MTQLDHMTRGRAMFGVGPGALVHDAAKIGVKAADQRSRMNESLDVIVELMAGKSVTAKTDWFDLTAAQLQLPSYSQPGMEMAVACARSPVGAVASGRHGIGMLSIGGTSDDALKAHAYNWKIYTDHARQNGKVADRSKWRIVTFAHVAPTREQALEEVKFGIDRYAKYFNDVATFPILPSGITDAAEFLTREGIACIGTPDDCIRHFERLWKGSDGGFGAVLLLANNWADWPATLRSYELMARFVHPHFQRGANTLRQLSYDIAAGNRGTYSVQSQAAVETEIKKYADAQSKRAAE